MENLSACATGACRPRPVASSAPAVSRSKLFMVGSPYVADSWTTNAVPADRLTGPGRPVPNRLPHNDRTVR